MIRVLITLFFISLVFSAKIPNGTGTGRIIGGQEAAIGQFPHQASMRSAANAHFCGGFILNDFWVGCAAHCTVNRLVANTRVVAGAHHRINGGITYAVSQIVNHPNYSGITLANDISVVRTETPILQSATVRPIALEFDFVGTHTGATASGWGQTTHPGSAAENLQFLSVDVITNDECRSRLSLTNAARIGDSTICVSSPNGQG
jgi:trypsin